MQGIFESMETKESAFEAAGTDGDAKKIEDVLWGKSDGRVDGDILEFFRENRHRGLTDRAACAIPMDILKMVIFDIEANGNFIATSGVGFGMVEMPLTPTALLWEREFSSWVTVVVENVFGVQIHSTSL